MTNAALTELDYRKILIDIEGITNAWFSNSKSIRQNWLQYTPSRRTKLYINVLEDKLSFDAKDKNNTSLEQLSVRGLNKIIIELG
jgi:hypothetical protein